jgi:hypothetical protein
VNEHDQHALLRTARPGLHEGDPQAL